MILRLLSALARRAFPPRRVWELGAITGRSILIFGGSGLALIGLGIGVTTAIPGTSTTTTTTTVATTTTTTTVPPTTTTTTTVPPTTTTTVPGGDPCAAENPGLPGFPCTVNTGVHGVTFTAANTAAHDATHCTVCPVNLTWSPSNGYRFTNCGIVDRWKIVGNIDVQATNGNHPVGLTEAQTISQSCLRITNSLLVGPEPGKTGDVVLSTGFTGGGGVTCNFNGSQAPCGPVYLADSEVFGSHPSASGTCGTRSGFAVPCNTGFSYTVSDTNLHLWRSYLHGTAQGLDSDGWSEMHDSYSRADRSDQLTIDRGHSLAFCAMGPSGFGVETSSGLNDCSGHGDAYFQDSGGSGPWELIDHSTVFCGAQMLFCARDGAFFGDLSAPDGAVVKNNLFKGGGGVTFCIAPGINGGSKPHPVGVNLNFKNNTFETVGGNCTHAGTVDNGWTLSYAATNNDHWCNNRLQDGSLVNAALETGSCP